MQKKWLITALISITLATGVSTTIVINPTKVEASRSYKAYIGYKSITYKDRRGKMTITGVEALHMKYSDYSSAWSQIIIYGKFINKSDRGISPQYFANDHFRFFQVKHSKWHELDPVAPIVMTPTKHIDHLSSNGEDRTRPHRSVTFAIADDDPISLSSHQKVLVRAYKETEVTRRLASKILTSPETQNAMDHNDVPYNKNPYTSAAQRRAIKRVNNPHYKPKKQKLDTYNGDDYENKQAILTEPFRQDFYVLWANNNMPAYVMVLEFYLTNRTSQPLNVMKFLNQHVKIEPDMPDRRNALNLTNKVNFPIYSRVDEGLKKAQGNLEPGESSMVALANVTQNKYDEDVDTFFKNNKGKTVGMSRSKFKTAYPVYDKENYKRF